jgi:hypothetical protein
VVDVAIPASNSHPSKIGRSSPMPPIVARWSIAQQWSKRASSAIFQTAEKLAMEASWESLIPTRSGCFNDQTSVAGVTVNENVAFM